MAFRVAILEDQQIFRESLQSLLQSAGYEVTCASGVLEDFVARVRATPPDVAVVDLRLERVDSPDVVDGTHAVRVLRSLAPPVRTVVLSAYCTPDVIQRSLDAGAAAFLCKMDVGVTQVVEMVGRLARGEEVPRPEGAPPPGTPPTAEQSVLGRLTSREREVLFYVASGADNLKIAAHLDITERTVKAHITSIYRKLGVENRTQMAMRALQLGLARPPGPAVGGSNGGF